MASAVEEGGIALPACPVFSGVRKHITALARKIEGERFSRFLAETPLPDLSPDYVRGEMLWIPRCPCHRTREPPGAS